MKIYVDESGFTGEDLMNREQPVFVLASATLPDDIAEDIKRRVFSGIRAQELKHSSLARQERGRRMVLEFIRAIGQYQSSFGTEVVHKEFCALTKLVDWWVECAMHRTGFNLYERGANVALSNVCYLCLRTFESPQFVTKHLTRFQKMMRQRSARTYREFWKGLRRDRTRCKRDSKELIDYFLLSEQMLGPVHLAGLPQRSLDVTLSVALHIVEQWRERTHEDLEILHDESSTMAREQWLWDALVSPDVPPTIIGFDDRISQFPLRVTSTAFVNSTTCTQLQLCDILAGASLMWARRNTDFPKLPDYANALNDAGIGQFLMGGIWPSDDVTPRQSTDPDITPVDPNEFLGTIYREALRRRTQRGG